MKNKTQPPAVKLVADSVIKSIEQSGLPKAYIHQKDVKVSLPINEWLTLARIASHQKQSVDDLISGLLRGSEEPVEFLNDEVDEMLKGGAK